MPKALNASNKKFDKKYFYEKLSLFKNKHVPIFFNMPLNHENFRYRLIFSWTARKPNGDFNPIMSAQLIDTYKSGSKKYVVPDLIFDCIKENVTTTYKLYKYLNSWITKAFEIYKE